MSLAYLSTLTRAEVCGRLWALRRALEELEIQERRDGNGAFAASAHVRVEMHVLTAALEVADTLASHPVHQGTERRAAGPERLPLPVAGNCECGEFGGSEKECRVHGYGGSHPRRARRALEREQAERGEPIPQVVLEAMAVVDPLADGRTFADVDYFTEGDIRHANGEF